MSMEQKIQNNVTDRLAGKLDFEDIEMNQRADLVMGFDMDISAVAVMTEEEVDDLLSKLDGDCDYSEGAEQADNEVFHYILCPTCGEEVELYGIAVYYRELDKFGWEYECCCGHTGFVDEVRFDG